MKRFFVFCFYDKNGIADEYVYYLLDKIKPFCNDICIVMNGEINSQSEVRFRKYTDKILKRKNEGYDSGAFKQAVKTYGFNYLRQFDEVIFSNDTFYGPLFDLEHLFNRMESNSDIDFWGITKHPAIQANIAGVDICEHLQSYFLAYKRKILTSPDFEEYWNGVKLPNNYDEAIIFYELYTTKFFTDKGYKAGSFIDINPEFSDNKQPYFYEVSNWVKTEHIPFIKRKIFEMDKCSMRNPIKNGVVNLLNIIHKETDYDVNIIYDNLKRLYDYNTMFGNRYLMLLQYTYILIKRTLMPRKFKHYQKKLYAIESKLDFISSIFTQKRILLVSHDLSLTGAPTVLLWLAKYLIKRNYKVDVVTYKNGMSYELLDKFKELGVNIKYIKNKPSLIKKFCSKNIKKYNLIICNTVVTYNFVKTAAQYDKPVIWYIHETKLLNDYIKNFPDFKDVLVNFQNIYTVSEYAANNIRKYNTNVKIIPNGTEDEFEKFYNNKNCNITFGYIGSVNQLKGCDVLINVFTKLVNNYPNARLIVAGKNQNQSIIDSLKITNNVKWLKQLSLQEKSDFFRQTDVLCVPSLDDPCPLSLLEGTMFGKAIITTSSTGNNYLVKNNESGFIVPPKDEDALYKAMEYFCLNNDKVELMQKESRKMYLKCGTKANQEKKINELLKDFCV